MYLLSDLFGCSAFQDTLTQDNAARVFLPDTISFTWQAPSAGTGPIRIWLVPCPAMGYSTTVGRLYYIDGQQVINRRVAEVLTCYLQNAYRAGINCYEYLFDSRVLLVHNGMVVLISSEI